MSNHRCIFNILIGTVVFVFNSGCANLNSVHRALDINEGKGVLIDIKQRAIIVKNRTVNGKTVPVVCAEPSPDSLSAYVSALSGNVDVYSKVSVGLESQIQENALYVGLRTQSIQLLRDFLYRDCEAYMNDAIDKYQYDVLMRRNQKYMVALLGIEQLTGAVVSTPSVLDSAPPPAKIDTPGKETEKKNESGGTAARTTSGTTGGTVTGTTTGTGTSDNTKKEEPAKTEVPTNKEDHVKGNSNIELVASVVDNIVTQILQTDDIGQSCFAYLAGSQNPPNTGLAALCSDYLSKAAEKKINSNKVSSVCIDILSKVASSGAKPDEVLIILDKLSKSPLCFSAGDGVMKIHKTNEVNPPSIYNNLNGVMKGK
ncbi:MAG: hypothetical protein ACYDHC_06100 [Desulfuromonadaceae bacterium]